MLRERICWILGATASLALCVGVAVGPRSATARRPAIGSAPATSVADAQCIACHAEEAAAWHGSQHQTSYVEAEFQTALAREPRAFCRGCHAPLSQGGAKVDAVAAQTGVGCVSCHVRDGVVIAGVAARRTGMAPHPVVRSASLGLDDCGGCHEFEFPDGSLRDRPLLMQRTISEHARSSFANVPCAECHMPRDGDGRRNHRFLGSRDPEFVRSAVHITATRPNQTTLRVVLRAGEAGHDFPTGDLLRRIEVGATVLDGEREGAPRRRFLGRHFVDRAQASGAKLRVELADDRVRSGGERIVDLHLPTGEGRPIKWWVEYQRVAHDRSFDPADAAIDGVIPLAGGVVRHDAR